MNQYNFVVAVTAISALAFVLIILAVATEHWIEATAVLSERLQSNVNYGLFYGSVERQQLASTLNFRLTLVCDLGSCACMYSCQRDSQHRQMEMKLVLQHEDLQPCEQSDVSNSKMLNHYYMNSTKMSLEKLTSHSPPSDVPYISSSIHLCSVMFLCLGLIFSGMALLCSCINLRWHPVERIFNIFGLYIWNSIAAGCSFWCVALWSALFGNHLCHNISITDTLRQELNFTSEGYARLGYSYYLVIVNICLHIINLLVLFARRYFLAKQPHKMSNNGTATDEADGKLEFY